jgi:hypothetical protein
MINFLFDKYLEACYIIVKEFTMAQDDTRENEQIRIFDLERKSESNRGSKYLPDAVKTVDGKSYDIELKTGSKGSFSTARGMCREKIMDWKKNDFFIFSKYEKDKDSELGFKFTKHIVCKPTHLQFFFDHVIDKVNISGHAGKIGFDQYDKLIKPFLYLIPEFGSDKKLLEKFEKTIRVGAEYNDPKISIKKIVENGGHELDLNKDLTQQIINYIKTNP